MYISLRIWYISVCSKAAKEKEAQDERLLRRAQPEDGRGKLGAPEREREKLRKRRKVPRKKRSQAVRLKKAESGAGREAPSQESGEGDPLEALALQRGERSLRILQMALGSELFRDPELEKAWESWKRSSEAKESLAEHRKLEAWLRESL